MPVYTYKCETCGIQFERQQSFLINPLPVVPNARRRACARFLRRWESYLKAPVSMPPITTPHPDRLPPLRMKPRVRKLKGHLKRRGMVMSRNLPALPRLGRARRNPPNNPRDHPIHRAARKMACRFLIPDESSSCCRLSYTGRLMTRLVIIHPRDERTP